LDVSGRLRSCGLFGAAARPSASTGRDLANGVAPVGPSAGEPGSRFVRRAQRVVRDRGAAVESWLLVSRRALRPSEVWFGGAPALDGVHPLSPIIVGA